MHANVIKTFLFFWKIFRKQKTVFQKSIFFSCDVRHRPFFLGEFIAATERTVNDMNSFWKIRQIKSFFSFRLRIFFAWRIKRFPQNALSRTVQLWFFVCIFAEKQREFISAKMGGAKLNIFKKKEEKKMRNAGIVIFISPWRTIFSSLKLSRTQCVAFREANRHLVGTITCLQWD